MPNFQNIAIIFFVTVIVIAHFFKPTSYKIRVNTINELAAQRYRHKWFMQVGFIGFGILQIVSVFQRWDIRPLLIVANSSVILYALFVIVTGVYNPKPWVEGPHYSNRAAFINSLFNQMGSTVFCIAVMARIFAGGSLESAKAVHLIILLTLVILSALAGQQTATSGIWDRLWYIIALGWLTWVYNAAGLAF